jgi:hypothetical protein
MRLSALTSISLDAPCYKIFKVESFRENQLQEMLYHDSHQHQAFTCEMINTQVFFFFFFFKIKQLEMEKNGGQGKYTGGTHNMV